MSTHYKEAREGKEFRPTYTGKIYHIDDKIIKDPRYKERVPSRWVYNGWVYEEDKNGKKI